MWEPLGTVPANGTACWKSCPNERGKLNILSTCIVILLLCAYTSLHMNIPKEGKAGWKHQMLQKLLWVIVGLCEPEFVTLFEFVSW
jgi:hypothetical protein